MQASSKPGLSVNIATNRGARWRTARPAPPADAHDRFPRSISSTAAKQILFDINMGIADKRVTALIGPSGCGKSTLLRT